MTSEAEPTEIIRDLPWQVTLMFVGRYIEAMDAFMLEFMRPDSERDRRTYEDLSRKLHHAATELEAHAPGILRELHSEN